VLDVEHHFSLAAANAFVPRLTEVFREVREDVEVLRTLARELAEEGFPLGDEGPVEVDPDAPEAIRRRQSEAHVVAGRIGAALDGVAEMGLEVKGLDGLVDFRSRHRGETVYLCWRYGEDAIEHWHTLDGGFAGRRAIGPGDRFEGDAPQ